MSTLVTYAEIKQALIEAKTIAIVGISANPVKASYFVARYLHHRGYNIIPVNPAYADKELFGQRVISSLSEIPKDVRVDIVDIFRRSEFVPDIVDEVIEHLLPDIKTIWMQFGISHSKAAAKAHEYGINTVEDRCPKIEYQRLFGELRKAGINTGIVTSKIQDMV